jgi:glycosyltransferase involved in cell wall biosynthesis
MLAHAASVPHRQAPQERRYDLLSMRLTADPVLIVTPRWVRDGGVATHAMASAAALADSGASVHVLTARVGTEPPLTGVTVHCNPELLSTRASPALRVGDALTRKPALVHMHQLDDPELVAFMHRDAPVVISMHGYSACSSGVHYFRPGHECSRAHGAGCVVNLLARGCAHTRDPRPLPSAYRHATRAVQALTACDLAISYSSVIDRHLQSNGVSPRRVLPLFSTIAPLSGTGHETRRRVVFAGRVVTPKGVGVLLRAAAAVDGEFVICGDGWGLEAMRRLARRLGLAERVRFTGWLAPDALAQELADASVVAMPSLWPEPFGLVGIEANAAGRPVVASATGGVVDWLSDGVNGLLVTPGDARALATALSELLADPARQREMGAAGKAMVAARFSLERHLDALLEAYGAARAAWESTTAPARTPSRM